MHSLVSVVRQNHAKETLYAEIMKRHDTACILCFRHKPDCIATKVGKRLAISKAGFLMTWLINIAAKSQRLAGLKFEDRIEESLYDLDS